MQDPIRIQAPSLRRPFTLFACLLCLFAEIASEAADRALITSISTFAEKAVIRLSAPIVFKKVSLAADQQHKLPPRCYVDISPAVLGKQVLSSIDIHNGKIQRVRTGQFRPDTARIVFDLAAAQLCQARQYSDPDRLEISIGSTADNLSNDSNNASAAAMPDEQTRLPTQLAAVAPVFVPMSESRAQQNRPQQSPVKVSEEKLRPSRRAENTPLLGASSSPTAVGQVGQVEQVESATPEPIGGAAATLGSQEPVEPVIQGPVIPLEEAYGLAVQNEERIKIASHELGKARLLPWRAITQLTPRSDIQGIYTRNKDEISFTGMQSGGSRSRSG